MIDLILIAILVFVLVAQFILRQRRPSEKELVIYQKKNLFKDFFSE